jgi:aldehyde:ferredoxin oxidoreductase
MSPANGYAGKILRVDLTNEKLTEEKLSEAELRKWVGGACFGAKYLYEEVKPETQWDSPDNRLIVASGPLGGTRIGGSGTISISCKGTLTGGATSTQANGFMGAFMKFSGYDAVIFQGIAKRWVYLYMHDGKAELRDAQYLVGKNTWDTENAIKKELGFTEKQMSVFCIGPAGENLVKFAGVFGDKDHAAGHNGSGAVMGSKKLKAFVAARGKGTIPVANGEKLAEISNAIYENIVGDPAGKLSFDWGTGGNYERGAARVKGGTLPIKNYTDRHYHHPVRPGTLERCSESLLGLPLTSLFDGHHHRRPVQRADVRRAGIRDVRRLGAACRQHRRRRNPGDVQSDDTARTRRQRGRVSCFDGD